MNNPETRTVAFSLTGTVDVRVDLTPVRGWDGRIIGFRTLDTRTVRPQLVLEVENPDGTYEDFAADQDWDSLGFSGLDYETSWFQE